MGRCSQKMRGLRKSLWAPHASRPAEFGTSLLGLFTPGTLRSQRIPATPESPRWKAAEALDGVPVARSGLSRYDGAPRATDSIVWWSWDATPILYSRCQASSRKPEVVASGRWPVLDELQR